MHIARVGERLPRLQIQFRISRSFRPRNLANLGSKNPFLDSPKGTHPQTWEVLAIKGIPQSSHLNRLFISLDKRAKYCWLIHSSFNIGSVIRDHSDHVRSNEPMNPLCTRIHRFI